MEMKRSNGSWICEFIEQLSYDGHMKVERRCSPVKLGFAALRSRSSPNDPSRKHAVEQSLNQCRSEKVFTVLPFKFHTKGVFQGSSNAGQEEGRCSLDASECVLGVEASREAMSSGAESRGERSITRRRYSSSRSPTCLAAPFGCLSTFRNSSSFVAKRNVSNLVS